MKKRINESVPKKLSVHKRLVFHSVILCPHGSSAQRRLEKIHLSGKSWRTVSSEKMLNATDSSDRKENKQNSGPTNPRTRRADKKETGCKAHYKTGGQLSTLKEGSG